MIVIFWHVDSICQVTIVVQNANYDSCGEACHKSFKVKWLRGRIHLQLIMIVCWGKNLNMTLQRLLVQTYKLFLNLLFSSKAGLELLLDQVNDLVEFRIDAVLQDMNRVPLCMLPEDEPLSCEEFLQKTKVSR